MKDHINLLLSVSDNHPAEVQSYFAVVVLNQDQIRDILEAKGVRGLEPQDDGSAPVGFLYQDYNCTAAKVKQMYDDEVIRVLFKDKEYTNNTAVVLGPEYDQHFNDVNFSMEFHGNCHEIENVLIEYGDEHFRYIAYNTEGWELKTAWIPFKELE